MGTIIQQRGSSVQHRPCHRSRMRWRLQTTLHHCMTEMGSPGPKPHSCSQPFLPVHLRHFYWYSRSTCTVSTHSNTEDPLRIGRRRSTSKTRFIRRSVTLSVSRPRRRSATSLVGCGFIRRSAVPTAQRWPVQSAVRSSVPARDGGLRLLVALYGAAAAAAVAAAGGGGGRESLSG